MAVRSPLVALRSDQKRSAQRGVVPDREIDPFRRRPIGMFGADFWRELGDNRIRAFAGFALLRHAVSHVENVIAAPR